MLELRKYKVKVIKNYLFSSLAKTVNILLISCLISYLTLLYIFLTVNIPYVFYIIGAAGFLLLIISMTWIYHKHYPAYNNTEKILQSYNLGYDSKALHEIDVYYSSEMEKTFSKFFSLFENMNAIKLTNTHAEYRALQNQINPHFLYNTLEAIRSDALCVGAEDIANITEALATFFRYIISNVNSMVTLEAELNNSENYFEIQNYRFGDRINLKVNMDEDDTSALEYLLPKLTLQPIIENAIIHGLEHKVGRGSIEIDITTTEDRLIIKISDDGIGMEEELLNSINQRLHEVSGQGLKQDSAEKGGIALINVNNRIKLQFGEKYGLRIYSIKNFGTSVEVTLPLLKEVNR